VAGSLAATIQQRTSGRNRPQQSIADLDRDYAEALTGQTEILSDCLRLLVGRLGKLSGLDEVTPGGDCGQGWG